MLVSNVDNKFRLKMWISNVDYKCGLQISKKFLMWKANIEMDSIPLQ